MKYVHVIRAIYEQPWAILPEYVALIQSIIQERAGGYLPTEDEIRARIGAVRGPDAAMGDRSSSSAGAVAVLPLYGVISQRMNLMMEVSGGTSTERFAAMFREAMADPSVGSVLLDVDSPGGGVFGVPELADEIYAARGRKPIVAIANSMAASAAYWIAASADELVVTPSGMVGSIGVYTMHQDFSRAEDMAGIKTTLISAGKYKVEGNEFEPLDPTAEAAMQETVDNYYAMFTNAVARNRGASVADVRGGYGQGRVVPARDAVRMGLADRVATFDETIARMMRGAPRKGVASTRSAAADLEFRRRRLRQLSR